jgi:hypothetical protein
MSDIIKTIKSLLYNKFGVNRKKENWSSRQINDRKSDLHRKCPKMCSHLHHMHGTWYDDEREALFFTIYDYIRKNKIPIKIERYSQDSNYINITMNDWWRREIVTEDQNVWALMTLYMDCGFDAERK